MEIIAYIFASAFIIILGACAVCPMLLNSTDEEEKEDSWIVHKNDRK